MSYTQLRQTLAESLITAYQVSEDDIASILPENESDFKENDFKTNFLNLDKARIQTINQKGKEKFEQGYSKAKKEERVAYESEIKEHFNIDDENLIGLDLVKKVVELNAKTTKVDASKLSEDELKSHPSVIKMLNDKDKVFKEQEKLLKTEYDNKINAFNRERTFNSVSKRALAYLDEMNPVLSTDPTRASNQKNILLKELEQYDYQDSEEDFIPLKDGKRLENEHGHGISFKQLVQNKAGLYFDFKQAEPRNTPPAGGEEGGTTNVKVPKTEQEYAKIMTDRTIPLAERAKIKEAWNKQAAS